MTEKIDKQMTNLKTVPAGMSKLDCAIIDEKYAAMYTDLIAVEEAIELIKGIDK